MKFIIEHLEPQLFEWCVIEYAHVSEMVGRENVLFTNVRKKDFPKLSPYGEVTEKKVAELHLRNACVLDPHAKQTLVPADSKQFEYFIFGGILGNNPAEKRTAQLTAALPCPARNLGQRQLSTDTAAYVAKRILEGKKLEEFRFVDEVEVQLDDGESVTLPFPYAVEGNHVVISKKLIGHLKKRGKF